MSSHFFNLYSHNFARVAVAVPQVVKAAIKTITTTMTATTI